MSRALSLCLVVAAATWAIASSRALAPGARRAIAALAIAGVVGSAFALRGEGEPPAREPSSAETQWSPEAVASALADDRVVLVDFTAAWCITCKVNERLVLGSEPVRRALRDAGATVLVADWTERDATIRAELARHGKAGVPLYLVFSPAAPDAPEVLPELLTEATVIDAIARARGGTR